MLLIYNMDSTSTNVQPERKKTNKKMKLKKKGIYNKNIINYRVHLNITELGNNIHQNLETKLKNSLEGKCTKDGYIKHDSIVLQTYSSGLIKGNTIVFDTVFECLICRPVEGMRIYECLVQNNTKAGIKAVTKEDNSPVIIFISRDQHYDNKSFSNVKAGDIIDVRVIGIRYELNDSYISVLGEYLEKKAPPKLVIKNK